MMHASVFAGLVFSNACLGLAHTVTQRDEKNGAGVGLALVKKILEAVGEGIWLEQHLVKTVSLCYAEKMGG
jgi:light-regulated signal transduction histidine kinase (bacteriophytochrome)